MNDIATLRIERELWLDFVHKVKKDRKKVRDVLRPFLRKYCASNENTRVLLLLVPRESIDELFKKEDPDRFIQEAIQERLANQE